MNQSFPTIVVGGLIRVVQGFAAAAPTLLVGLLIAAILRFYFRPHDIRRLFGGESLRSLPQSWLVGMLLPVCSIGVLPILREMQRAGVKPGAMAAFALAAPLFNPLSLLYGLTLSRPLVIILFAFGSLLIVTALGLYWDTRFRFLRRFGKVASEGGAPWSDEVAEGSESGAKPSPSATGEAADDADADWLIGQRRLAASVIYLARELTGRPLAWTLLAVSGLAVLAGLLPFGSMQASVERDDWLAPLNMLWVSIPVYATPMLAMSQLGMMFQHANSPGAAFTLLILGTGLNVATPIWFGRHYGWKAAAAWLLSLVIIVLGISYAINKPLVPHGVEPAGHTHAFDIYANPIPASQTPNWATAQQIISKSLTITEVVPLALLGAIALLGLVFRGLGMSAERLQEHAPAKALASSLRTAAPTQRSGLDVVVPPSVIGSAMLFGLIALSVVACYAYYPSPEECLEEISFARSECLAAVNSGDREHALYWLPVWEDWSRRLEVGTFLRRGKVRPYQRMQGYLIRKKLELLEHELEHDPYEPEVATEVGRDLLATNNRWVHAFRPQETPGDR